MKLRTRVPKVYGVGVHREITAAETFQRIAPHLRRAGITRVADITWLDRIGIPVYNAISPRSNDIISVYNGKGFTPIEAKTSAVMEAIERFAASLPRRPDAIASYNELIAAGRRVMHPAEYVFELAPYYNDDLPISWTEGFDLMSGEPILVPQDAACYVPRFHEAPCYKITTTNGLASGNSLEEAICHALCEVIERDAITISEIVSNYLSQILEKGLSVPRQSKAIGDKLRELHPHVDLSTLSERAQALIDKFHQAGIEIKIIRLTGDIGIPTFMAAAADDLGPMTSKGHGGFGTHPDAEVAIIRAITECAQGRAVDIQAMREDISLPGSDVPKYMYHVRRSSTFDKGGWLWKPVERKVIDARTTPSYQHDDVMDDVRFMLNQLRAAGITKTIVVDLSPPHIPVAVVRLIVPRLESWAVDHCKIGVRATTAWKKALHAVSQLNRRLATVQSK